MDMNNLSPRELAQHADESCPGCNGWYWRCECPVEGQAPVASESPESARERIPTAADGVPVSMADLVGGCLR